MRRSAACATSWRARSRAIAEAKRGLEIAEREAIKEELARDAALADLQQQVAKEHQLREALEKDHERALEAARDEALLQALAELKARKK